MPNTQPPSIGRIVHYQAHGSPNGQHKSEPRAAVITGLHYGPANIGEKGELSTECVDLCVLNPTGMYFNVACIFDADAAPGSWRWPPRV